MANAAFVDLAQVASEDRLRGEPIEKWIGRPGLDVDVLFANLQNHGALRNFSTVMRGEHGTVEDVEVSAVDVSDGGGHCLGFCIRGAGWRSGRERLGGRELPRTAEQFADLVGRVPLKNLVRETTDLIETAVHRGRARADQGQSRFGGRDAWAQPAGSLYETAPLWAWRSRRRGGR